MSKNRGKSFQRHEMCFNYTRNTLQTRSKILDLLQNSIKIPYSDFKILFKSLKYIQSSLKSVLKYSWFGKGMSHARRNAHEDANVSLL